MFRSHPRAVRLQAVTGVAIVALAAQPALAADLDVTATVANSCNVTTTAVAFGTVDTLSSVADDADGGLSLTCTSGAAWTASAGTGLTGTLVTARKMANGANHMNYGLYKEAGRTTNFTTATGTGTGGAQPVTIYGRVPAGQTGLPAGSYTDKVAITVSFT